MLSYTNTSITVRGAATLACGASTIAVGYAGEDLIPVSDKFTVKSQWKKVTEFPGESRALAKTFSVNGKGYVGFGNDESKSYNDLWEYDPTTNLWTQKASPPVNLSGSDAVFVIGNKAYLLKGIFHTRMYVCDTKIDQWTDLDLIPFNGLDRSAFALDGKGYVGLGQLGEWRKDLWQYDPVSNEWHLLNDFVGEGRAEAVSFLIDNQAYVFGGSDGSDLNDLWVYKAEEDNWVQKNSLPVEDTEDIVGFAVGGYGYVGLGGNFYVDTDGELLRNTTYEWLYQYEPGTDEWIRVQDFAGGARNQGTLFTIGDKAYYGMGYTMVDNQSVYHSDVWEFNPNP